MKLGAELSIASIGQANLGRDFNKSCNTDIDYVELKKVQDKFIEEYIQDIILYENLVNKVDLLDKLRLHNLI